VTSAGSGNVCPVDDGAQAFVVGVAVSPDDVAADHAALLLVVRVVGAVEGEGLRPCIAASCAGSKSSAAFTTPTDWLRGDRRWRACCQSLRLRVRA
jgi:hypothetical protein